ncbi:hypothetical protein ACQPZF_27860 [Actinosynnema sp. CS-041913]|uniref:hypothetical protein n=1 Tax=Actinosynnema sp. CS-041913 TaxID=3239917 RepID=UPI003D8CCDD0
MSPVLHTALAELFGLMVLIGTCALLLTVGVDVGDRKLDCGSAVTGLRGAITYDPHDKRTEEVAVHRAACEDAIGTRRGWAWPVGLVGLAGMAVLIYLVPLVNPTPQWWRHIPRNLHR